MKSGKKIRKRTAYVETPELPLAIKPVVIMGYGKRKDFACRLEIQPSRDCCLYRHIWEPGTLQR